MADATLDLVKTLLQQVSGLAAVGTLIWGVLQFRMTARTQADTRSLEARRPFLDMQLSLYTEAVRIAALLATTDDLQEKQTATKRFWQLYWGELAVVENGGVNAKDGGVEDAMVAFGKCLQDESSTNEQLQRRALELAHACRDSLGASWGVRDWYAPTYSPSDQVQSSTATG